MGPGTDASRAIPRPTARTIVLDEGDHVLLMRGVGAFVQGVWFTPGGGLEPHESPAQAARRELWEETSLRVGEIGPRVWTRSHVWCTADGIWYRSDEQFFVVRTGHFEPRFARAEDPEATKISEFRWWSMAAIAEATERFAPRRLARLLPPILAGVIPASPIDVGL